jgi:hypothetical protein
MVLFAKYNGDPPDALKATYGAKVLRRMQHLPAATPDAAAPPSPPWDAIDDPPGEPAADVTFNGG